jgi:hypothetical protein
MRWVIAILLFSTGTLGCAAHVPSRTPDPPGVRLLSSAERQAAMQASVARIPLGSAVRVVMASGHRMKATLVVSSAEDVVLRLRGRQPDAEVRVALADIRSLELYQQRESATLGRAALIGALSGAGATLGVLWILFATCCD